MQDKFFVACTSVVCLTVLGGFALLKGIDSGLLTAISAGIGAVCGYAFGIVKGAKA